MLTPKNEISQWPWFPRLRFCGRCRNLYDYDYDARNRKRQSRCILKRPPDK